MGSSLYRAARIRSCAKRNPPKCGRSLGEDTGGDGLVQELGKPRARQPAGTGEQLDIEFPPNHRRYGQRAVAVLGQSIEAPPDDLAHSLRNPERPGFDVMRRVGVDRQTPAIGPPR